MFLNAFLKRYPAGWLMAAGICLSLSLSAGCGRGGDDGTITLRLMRFSEPGVDRIYDRLISEFEAQNPGVIVKQEMLIRQEQLQTQMVGNTAPDVILMANKSLADFGTRGMLLDLKPLIDRDSYPVDDIFSQAWDEGGVPGGEVYGLPVTGGPEVLYYNRSLFDAAGLEYPDESWSWEDFLQAAKKLTISDKKTGHRSQVGCSNFGGAWTSALPWIWAAGGDLLNPAMDKVILDSPETRQAIQFLVDLQRRHGVTTSADLGAQGSASDLFLSGKMAMFIYLPWNTLNQFAGTKGLSWDMAPVPRGTRGRTPRYSGESFSIWKGSRHQETAWKLARHLCSREAAVLFAERNWMPARKSVAESEHFIKKTTPFHEEVMVLSMEYARALPSIPYLGGSGGKLSSIWSDEMWMAVNGKKTVAEATSAIHKRLSAELAEEKARRER